LPRAGFKFGVHRQIIKCARLNSIGGHSNQEQEMAKGQQSNKMVKKPKKDTAPPKPVSPDAVRPTITTVVPVRGKLKNAPSR
jgi:hypothetical protein